MSVSAANAIPVYSDPDRLVVALPSERADTAAAARAAAKDGDGKHLSMFAEGDDSPSFWDVLDVINPLQHIPVVNTLYRELTGDQIGVGARMAGGALFGGPIGLAAAVASCVVEESTGKDIGEHALALFQDDAPAGDGQNPPTALAQAPAEQQPAAIPQAPAEAAILTLPDAPAAANAPMMFSVDGPVLAQAAAEPPPPAAAPQPKVSVAPATPAGLAAANGAPLALGPQQRFLATPARRTAPVNDGPAPVAVPISNNGFRSNVPITGRDPVANIARGPDPVAIQRAMAAQGLTGAQHPMLPETTAPASKTPTPKTLAPNGNQTTALPEWYSSMSQAMDKYEKAGKLGGNPAPAATLQ